MNRLFIHSYRVGGGPNPQSQPRNSSHQWLQNHLNLKLNSLQSRKANSSSARSSPSGGVFFLVGLPSPRYPNIIRFSIEMMERYYSLFQLKTFKTWLLFFQWFFAKAMILVKNLFRQGGNNFGSKDWGKWFSSHHVFVQRPTGDNFCWDFQCFPVFKKIRKTFQSLSLPKSQIAREKNNETMSWRIILDQNRQDSNFLY